MSSALPKRVIHQPERGLSRTLTALEFAKRLVASRGRVSEIDVALLRRAGFHPGEIAAIVSAMKSEARSPS